MKADKTNPLIISRFFFNLYNNKSGNYFNLHYAFVDSDNSYGLEPSTSILSISVLTTERRCLCKLVMETTMLSFCKIYTNN